MSEKKILLILPKYFGYEDTIREAMQKKGATVRTLFENREMVSFWHKFVYIYLPFHKEKVLERYYLRELKRIDKDFDIVLIIRGSSVSKKIIGYMKETFPPYCRFIMYQWDSVKNNENALKIADEFERVFTFDPCDAQKYGWKYRPLFYDQKCAQSIKKDIDILYICSMHSDRAKVLKYLKRMCEEELYILYAYMYVSRFRFIFEKYIQHNRDWIGIQNKDVRFKKLSLRETYKLYSRSRIVIDFTHPGQTGLTMRTIECLGCKCKLVTNNAFVRNADFYDRMNIHVYEGTTPEIPQEFLQSDYKELEPSLRSYYSLDKWMEEILGGVL